MLACKQVVRQLGRGTTLSKRWLATQEVSLPPEFEALLGDGTYGTEGRRVPLDAVVDRLAPPARVSWPAPPARKGSLTLAREFRAHMAAQNIPAALDVLRRAPQPHPRLLAHAAVHALLRACEYRRAGALLLSYSATQTPAKAPRMHPTTLAETTRGLLKCVPKTQQLNDWTRTRLRPNLLTLNHHMVSNAELRNAVALYIQARKGFVRRDKKVTELIWQALLVQREWLPAALMFVEQVKDYQLRRTLPTLLRSSDPDDPPLTPHDRDHLRRRLAILRLEQVRATRGLFSALCHGVGGVIQNITSRPEGGLMSPAVLAAHKRAADAAAALQPEPLNDPYSPRPSRFLDSDPDEAYGFIESDDHRYPYPSGAGKHPQKRQLTFQRARHHINVALQALATVSSVVGSRQIPFAEIRHWIIAVGSIPPSVAPFDVFVLPETGRPTRVNARKYLRSILENYASAMPRNPHIFSELHFGTSGFIRRGLKHKLEAFHANDLTLRTADASPSSLDGYLGPVELDGLTKRDRRKLEISKLNWTPDKPLPRPRFPVSPKLRHLPPEDPVEAADDSLMPPPPMPTYETLLGVFLNSQSGRGLIYEPAPHMTLASAKEAAQIYRREEAGEAKDVEAPMDAIETRVNQHYHAPHSPNNPHPEMRYPAHPLDFNAYPRVERWDHKYEPGPDMKWRGELAARVVRHMLYEREPPMPPWESPVVMSLLRRRREMFAMDEGLLDEVWAGAERHRREAEVRMAEARRLVREAEEQSEYDVGGWGNVEHRDVSNPMWRREEPADPEMEEMDTFNVRLAARINQQDEEMYYHSDN